MTNIPDVEAPSSTGYHSTVLSSRDRFPITIERILVPTDLTTGSERAIEYGFVLARRFGADLTLLHVYKDPYAVEYMRGPHACEAVLEERMGATLSLSPMIERRGKKSKRL